MSTAGQRKKGEPQPAPKPQFPSPGRPVGVVGAIGDQAAEWSGLGHQLRRDADVGVVAGCELQHDRLAEQVDDQVDLGAAAAAGYANGLILRRFFWAPVAERCAFT